MVNVRNPLIKERDVTRLSLNFSPPCRNLQDLCMLYEGLWVSTLTGRSKHIILKNAKSR